MKPGSIVGMGLKKGAWTPEEDRLLKNCIEKYGEGKWHLIPLKAGLNRCRKSCRIRWLNYLRPNLKRGDFADDEVDLILRLHKLLGNRWSLIAGRIPGRTANDVKNYWNTRFKQQKTEPNQDDKPIQDTKVMIYKPKPQTFPIALHMSDNPQSVAQDRGNVNLECYSANNDFNMSSVSHLPSGLQKKNINEYLDDLFDDCEMEIDGNFGLSVGSTSTPADGNVLIDVEQEDDQISLSDFPMDDVTVDFIY